MADEGEQGKMMQESNRARHAFEDYYALGPGRSLPILSAKYRKQSKVRPPTRQLSQLKKWSTVFLWQERIAQRDAEITAKALVGLEDRKRQALESGFALMFERVGTLKELAGLLWGEINVEDKRWLPDVKQIGMGENAERVDIVRFNAPLIEQFRKALDDIAAEVGERVKGLELSGKDGGPIQVQDMESIRRKRWEKAAPEISDALQAGNDG